MKAIFYRDFIADHIPEILKEIWWEGLYKPYFKDRTDMTVLDIGANVGLFTHFAQPYSKLVVAVEPSSMHVETLKKLVEFNAYDNVKIVQAAISNHSGEATFYHHPNTTMFSLTKLSEGETETVPLMTLDELTKDLPHVDFMKLDVEGEEMKILSKFDSSRIDQIMVEWHSWTGTNPGQLIGMLSDSGYQVKQIQTEATVFYAWK